MSSLNLTGSQFGNFDNGVSLNAMGALQTTARAVLCVLRPYHNQFEDVAIRPMNYRFDDNFLNEVHELTETALRAEMTHGSLIKGLKTKTNFNDYVVPTPQAQMTFKASALSHHHRFILILTDSASDLITPNTNFALSASNKMRRIYTGYFLDEPFSRLNFSSKPALNPNAIMVITHKTVVGMTGSSDQFGYRERMATHSSDDIFQYRASLDLTSVNIGGHESSIHLMTPEHCLSGVDSTAEGDTLILPGIDSDLSRWKANDQATTILNQPDHNVTHLVRNVIKHVDEENNRNIMLGRSTQASFDDRYVNEEIARMQMRSNLAMPRSRLTRNFDLDINDQISPVDIDNMVNGTLEVQDFDVSRPMYYETLDQSHASVLNQYSALIAYVVGPVISGAGLDSMKISYEIANMNGMVQDSWRQNTPMSNYPVSEEQMGKMIWAVKHELENGIFRTIFDAMGAFSVMIDVCVSGMTSVRLSLVDMGIINGVDYVVPTCMGGMVSPLLGDSASLYSNNQAVETLFGIATGSHVSPGNFDSDDIAFGQYANRFMDSRNAIEFDR